MGDQADDPFVIMLSRHADDSGISVTVCGQTIRLSNEDARLLLDSLENWYYPVGRDADTRSWPGIYDLSDLEGLT